MRSQYEAPIDPAPPTLSVISGTTTIISAGTYYFWLYCRNRAGITNFSLVRTIAVTAGQGVQVTIPAAISTSGIVNLLSVGVVASSSSTPANGCVVASVSGSTSLPATINLTTDVHFGLNEHVATSSALPSAVAAIDGMRRYVDDINKIVEYKSATSQWVNCSPQVFNPWIASRLDEQLDGRRGCDRDLADIVDYSTIIFPDYPADNSYSESVVYWIVNDGTTTVLQGQRIRIALATDTFDAVSDDFKGLLQITFLGYVNTNTGVLDTSGMTVGGSFPYQGDMATNLVTQKDLLPGYAIALSVQLHFADYQVNNRISQGEVVKFYPRLAANYSTYDPASKDLGDRIWNVGGMRRLIPNSKGLFLLALSGSGSIAHYGFEPLGQQQVTGLAANTANQAIAISNTGVCFPANISLPSDTAALRAVVSTVDGPGIVSSWSTTPIALSSAQLLSLSITHPTIVRPDYPDVIAGTSALLNSNIVRVYVQAVGQTSIQYFDVNTLGLDETILVGSLATGTLTALPTVANTFGLFAPPTIGSASAVSGSSIFTGGNYNYAIGYYYSSTVTSISHSTQIGCVQEMLGTLVDALTISSSWGKVCVPASGQSVDDAIRNIPQSTTTDGQRRAVAGNPLIYFDASSTAAEVLTGTWSGRVWLPVWRTLSQPGRWRGEISIKGDTGATGATGSTGATGATGATGTTPVINVAATTLAYTASATATITGSAAAPTITFGIPQGTPGSSGSGSAPSSYNWLLLDSQGSSPSTGASQLGLFNASGVLSVRAASSGTVYPIATLGSSSGAKHVNALLNGNFQIAQTSSPWTLSAGTSFSYLCDGWQGTAGTGGAATISLVNLTITDGSIAAGIISTLQWVQTTSASDSPTLRSRIESSSTFAGVPVVVSFYAQATASATISSKLTQNFGTGGSTAVSTTPVSFGVTTTRSRFSFTATLPSLSGKTIGTNDSLDLIFLFPTSSTFQITIDSVELAVGSTPGFIVPDSIGKALNTCLRHLYKLSGASNQMIGAGRASATNTGEVSIPFPVPMRIAPSLAGWNDLLLNASVVTAATLNGVGVNGTTLSVTGTVTNSAVCMVKLNSTSSYLLFDARMPLA